MVGRVRDLLKDGDGVRDLYGHLYGHLNLDLYRDQDRTWHRIGPGY